MTVATLVPAPAPDDRVVVHEGVGKRPWIRILAAATKTRRGLTGLLLTGVVVLLATIGPFVAPYSPTAIQNAPFLRPSSQDWLGTDVIGRDVFSRLLHGGWVLLIMAVLATAIGLIIGAAAGIAAAYRRGMTDGIIMRTVDIVLAIPSLVFALLLVSVIGPKLWLVVLAVGLGHAPQVARVIRSAALDISERDFVRYAEITGAPPRKIMTREIAPSLISPLMVELGIRLTYSIVLIAGLAYLGFGQAPPAPSWGGMINENFIGLQSNPWGVVAPAILIAIFAVGTNLYTDSIARVAIGSEGLADPSLEPEIAASAESFETPTTVSSR
jgi:peptide/nickel transport system permease protein